MSALLVGGFGFIGVNLARYLRERGYDVCVAARATSIDKRRWLRPVFEEQGVQLYVYTELGADSILAAIRGCGARHVYYLAGAIEGSWSRLWEAHVGIWMKTLDAVSSSEGVEAVVYVSSVAAMGDASRCRDEDGYVVEEPILGRGCKPKGVYESTKAEGEQRGYEAFLNERLPVIIVRPVVVFGEYGYHDEWKTLYNFAKKGWMVNASLDTIYVGDVARAMVYLAENSGQAAGSWFILARPPPPYTIAEFSEQLVEKITGRPPTKKLDTMVKFGGILGGILSSVISRSSRLKLLSQWLGRKQHYKPKKLTEMGFNEWTPIDEAVEKTVEWMKKFWG